MAGTERLRGIDDLSRGSDGSRDALPNALPLPVATSVAPTGWVGGAA